MTTLAPHPFWLDGGYDFHNVAACRYHPTHWWVDLRMGDVLANPRDPDEHLTICRVCFVPRCEYIGTPNRCTLWRHHDGDHARR
jgi:hypothetical protein